MRWIAFATLAALVGSALYSVEAANAALIGLKDQVVAVFDWLFVGVASASVLFVLALGLLPAANVRLGREGDEPEFSRTSWFAMLFSAGLGSGLLYWAAAEPILHFQDNPILEARTASGEAQGAAVRALVALEITVFHWGLHGWSMYVLGALAIAVYSYRHGHALSIRSALVPVFGAKWCERWPGRAIDLLALLGTVFGVATSIGLSAAGLNAALASLSELRVEASTQIVIVCLVCGVGIASAASGVARGVRRLSEANLWVSTALLAAVFLLGPSWHLIRVFAESTFLYLREALALGIWLGTTDDERAWQGAWTLFYWGWWLAWMPFVSLFIARISKGRSVRELVFAVMGAPTLAILVWMVVLGGTGIERELAEPGVLSAAVERDYSLGIVALIESISGPLLRVPLLVVTAFLLFTWLITSLDSATLVLCHLVGDAESTTQKVIWGSTLAAVTSTLIALGGLESLQAASVIVGLPLAFVLIALAVGLVRDLWAGRL